MDLDKQLDGNKQTELNNYIENELENHLNLFEFTYGYRGNTSLIKWLILKNVFNENITFKSKGFNYLIIIESDFLTCIDKNKLNETHLINRYPKTESLRIFTPFLEIGRDGTGNYFYANFANEDSDVIIYDHEDEYTPIKSVTTLDRLVKNHNYKNLLKVIDFVIEKHRSIIKLPNNSLSVKSIKYNNIFGSISSFLYMLENGSFRINNFSVLAKEQLELVGCTKRELSKLLTEKDSEYYVYDNVRLKYNSLIILNLYWLYIAGQIETLKNLLEDSNDVKGKYYQVVIATFKEMLNQNYKNFNISKESLSQIRRNIKDFNPNLLEIENNCIA